MYKIKSCYDWFKKTWFGILWLRDGVLYVWEKFKNIFCYMCKKIQDNLIWLSIIISCIIVLSCGIGVYYFVEIPKDNYDITEYSHLSITKYSSLIRNLIIGIIALISFPFLVWRTVLASQQEKTAQKQLDVANDNAKTANQNANTALKVRIDKLYNDAVTQLSDDKETIRLASILTFQELLKTSNDDDFRKKIVDILWLFMVEHSREVIDKYTIYEEERTKDKESEMTREKEISFNKKNSKTKLYHSQFTIIIEIFTKYDDILCNDNWWKNKSMSKVWLYKADLQYAKFAYANLKNANLQGADLRGANLQQAKLYNAHLQGAVLREAHLQSTHLQGADLRGANLQQATLYNTHLEGADLRETNLQEAYLGKAYYDSGCIEYDDAPDPTKFPDGFNPKDYYNMIDVSEDTIDDNYDPMDDFPWSDFSEE